MQNEKLYFRELLETDAERLFEIYSNAEAMKYRETKPMKTLADAYEMLTRDKAVKESCYEFRFAVIEKQSEQLIGTVMYQPLSNKAVIGYSIDQNYWNKGYGSAIVKIISAYLKTKNFNLLEAWVKKDNIASCKVLEKSQFNYISQTIYPASNLYQCKIK